MSNDKRPLNEIASSFEINEEELGDDEWAAKWIDKARTDLFHLETTIINQLKMAKNREVGAAATEIDKKLAKIRSELTDLSRKLR